MSNTASEQDIISNKNEDSMKLKLSSLRRKLDKIYLGGGEKKIHKQPDSSIKNR